MTDAEFEKWADGKYEVFREWVHSYFERGDGYWNFNARKKRSVDEWLLVLADTPSAFNQKDGTRQFTLHSEEFGDTGNCLFIFFRYTAPDGQVYEPTEGMMINCDTGEMTYV